MAAYNILGLLGSIFKSEHPEFSSTYKTFFHVFPPSILL
jgi:hypothetical protein